jgi:hypothetical protein
MLEIDHFAHHKDADAHPHGTTGQDEVAGTLRE